MGHFSLKQKAMRENKYEFNYKVYSSIEELPEDLGKLAALSGVRDVPVRVKCASLCWHTLNAALDHRGDSAVKTE